MLKQFYSRWLKSESVHSHCVIDPIFQPLRKTLDAHMKELKGIGSYQPKRAEVISAVDENILWAKNLLGDETLEQLISTMVFYIGLYFSLEY